MIEKLKNILKAIGVFKYYMLLKRKLYLDRKLMKLEALQREKRVRFYAGFVHADQLVFDVGANVGNRTEVFIELGAKVVAVEPQPQCVEVLQGKFGKELIIENVGLDERAGELTMYIADESTISSFSKTYVDTVKSTRFQKNKWNSTIQVQVTTLDSLIAKHGVPAFCKVDVEGFELNVFKGLTTPIPLISFEYGVPEFLKELKLCIGYLHNLSPDYEFNYSTREDMEFSSPNWLEYHDFVRLVENDRFLSIEFGDIYVRLKDKL